MDLTEKQMAKHNLNKFNYKIYIFYKLIYTYNINIYIIYNE